MKIDNELNKKITPDAKEFAEKLAELLIMQAELNIENKKSLKSSKFNSKNNNEKS